MYFTWTSGHVITSVWIQGADHNYHLGSRPASDGHRAVLNKDGRYVPPLITTALIITWEQTVVEKLRN